MSRELAPSPRRGSQCDLGTHRESTPELPSDIDAMTGPSTVAQRYLLVHEYVGQCFSGWQKQPEGVKTVQSVLERAVSEFIGYETIVMGSSRTDTGVHALANTCHVDLCRRPRKANFSECEDNEMEVAPKRRPYSCYDVRKAINARIGEDQVRVTRVVKVGPDFHARFQAKGRTYFYRIACGPSDGLMSLFHSGQCWDVTKDLDVSLMRKAAALLVGTHDFSSFRTSKCQATSPVKTLESLKVEVDDGRHYWPMRYLGDEVTRRRNLLVTATARSFLYHQVRLMVGLLKAVGCGEIRLEDVSAILEARDVRALRTAMAPAHGLYLANVEYDPKDFEDGD